MGQEYFINSQELESKVRSLLPSQGGAGAGFDLSASTQIIPVIDLTESAEGSNLRQDLQSAVNFGGATAFSVNNTTTSVLTGTGFYRITGTSTIGSNVSSVMGNTIKIISNTVVKKIWDHEIIATGDGQFISIPVDFIVFLKADATGGAETLSFTATSTGKLVGSVRQIASIDGTLTNPVGFSV